MIAAAVLAVLSGGVWWANRHPPSSETKAAATSSTKLADITESDVQELILKKKDGSSVTIQRLGGKWMIVAPQQYPADQDAIMSILSALNPLTADSVVEEQTSDPGKYGLAKPALTVSVKERNGKSEVISFGDDVPAGSLVYVRDNHSPKIYAIASSSRSSFDKNLTGLRDKRLLTFDSNKLTQVELIAPKSPIVFARMNDNTWQIEKPKPYRADNFQVEELLRKLTDAKMDLSGIEDQKAIDSAFKAGQSVALARLTSPSGTQTLDVRDNEGNYYATSSAVSGTYRITADLGKQMAKPLEEYRNKKVFDFGFADPNKIELKQGTSTKTYVRDGQTWKLNGQQMDAASVQAFIDKLRDLTATKVVETGFTTPSVTITVVSNDGRRTEQVFFAKTNNGYIAKRGVEAAMYLVDTKTMDDVLATGSAIKPAAAAAKK